MADLARMARPWLLRHPLRTPAMVSAARIGLGGAHSISTTAACQAVKRGVGLPSKRDRTKHMEREATAAFLLPYTVVSPPLTRFPRDPKKFLDMAWLLIKNRAIALGALLSMYFLSMPGRFGWPKFRMNRSNAIPTAKTLHVQMSEAVAAGDKDTLRRICSTKLFETLAGAIDSRPRGVRTTWELVRYENRLRYPRVADFRIASQPLPGGKGMKMVKQAVVSIASVQKLTRYDRNGAVVAGSERERHMVEHIVLQADINSDSFKSEPWLVWGTLPEMTYESIREDTMAFDDVMAGPQRRI